MKVFYDVDTQRDFMDSNGSLYVPNAEQLKPKLKLLTEYAIKNNILILGSVDRHFDDDKELNIFPRHCMNKTDGQKKIPETIYKHNVTYIPSKIAPLGRYEEHSSNDIQIISKCFTQIIFEKQKTDVFTNRNIIKYLDKLRVSEVVVYGVATEYCIKDAVLGFLSRNIKVTIIIDAIKGINPVAEQEAIAEMKKKGAKFIKMNIELQGEK